MELRDLISALLRHDLIAARQWVQDAARERFAWTTVLLPANLGAHEQAIAAGIVETLAERAGQSPPAWTASVGGVAARFYLDPGLERYARSAEHARLEAPEPLRRRNLIAPADFLEVR